ncbi:hypothetical protein MN608_04211 [Microdochium nivale]|nr:hypothetical protein MN608_04211 [Microdochium nivale]
MTIESIASQENKLLQLASLNGEDKPAFNFKTSMSTQGRGHPWMGRLRSTSTCGATTSGVCPGFPTSGLAIVLVQAPCCFRELNKSESLNLRSRPATLSASPATALARQRSARGGRVCF